MGNKWRLGILGISLLAMVALTGCTVNPDGSYNVTVPPGLTVNGTPIPGGSFRVQPATGGSPTTSQPAISVPAAPATASGSSWTPAQKCDWLRSNFPQSTQTVQELGARLANVDKTRVRTHRYECDTSNNNGVFDGLIILGPNEGFRGEVTLSVPAGGAVDGYDTKCGARYSQPARLVAGGSPNPCDDTWRADGGTVTGQSLTYWPWNDDRPPGLTAQGAPGPAGTAPGQAPAATGTATASPATSPTPTATATAADAGKGAAAPAQVPEKSADCKLGKTLASDKGWKLTNPQPSDLAQYGGAQVTLDTAGELPAGWEALSSGRKITGDQADRAMVRGVWSIYPPTGACRIQLGVSN